MQSKIKGEKSISLTRHRNDRLLRLLFELLLQIYFLDWFFIKKYTFGFNPRICRKAVIKIHLSLGTYLKLVSVFFCCTCVSFYFRYIYFFTDSILYFIFFL